MTTASPAPELEFRADDHTYWSRGLRVPSVTECLKSVGLIPGLQYVADEDVWFGQRVHRLIHLFNKGTLDLQTVDDDLMPALDAYRDFVAATGFVPTSWEQPVHDSTIWVAGTYDVKGHFPSGHNGVVDLKTGVIKPWVELQLAGYARCSGDPFARRFGLSVRNGKPRMHEFRGPSAERLFVGAVSIHNWKLNNGTN